MAKVSRQASKWIRDNKTSADRIHGQQRQLGCRHRGGAAIQVKGENGTANEQHTEEAVGTQVRLKAAAAAAEATKLPLVAGDSPVAAAAAAAAAKRERETIFFMIN